MSDTGQQQWSAQEAIEIKTLRRKFARACQGIANVTKTKTADTGKYTYTYADLSDVLRTVKDALTVQGLALSQPVQVRDGLQFVDTMIIDEETGQYLMFPGTAHALERDPQAMGSALTYGRRYTLTSLFGMEVDDDDGRAAHTTATRPTERSGAEKEIRALVGLMDDEQRKVYVDAFKAEHGSNLTDLRVARHGDALGWTKWWIDEWEKDQLWKTAAAAEAAVETPTEENVDGTLGV